MKKFKINKYLKIVFWVAFISPWLIVSTVLVLVANGYFGALPTFEELESPKSNTASDLIADNGTLLGQYYVENRSFVDYDELSPYLVEALVSTEDARYYSHSGIDYVGLARVVVKSIAMNSKQGGGSTISQQLAKNLFPRDIKPEDGQLTRLKKTVIAKFKEWIIAVKLERNYTKEEIAVMYFNIVPYGSNSFGIKSAAQTFFNKLPSELNIQEAATLVGVVNAITLYNPVRNYDNSIKRRNTVIGRMCTNGKITTAERDSLVMLPIELDYKVASHNTGQATYFRSMIGQYMNASEPQRKNYYNKWDYEQEKELWDSDPLYGWCKKNTKPDGTPYNIYRDGLRIYTTLNPTMQRYAEESLVEHLRNTVQPSFSAEVKNRGSVFVDLKSPEQEKIIWASIVASDRYRNIDTKNKTKEQIMGHFKTPVKMKVFSYASESGVDTLMTPYDSIIYHKSILRGSFVAMEPTTGHVKAYVGGNNFRFFQYDMVRQGKRQVGSTVKPFIYTFAIDHLGLTPCTAVPNEPVTVDGWSPAEDGVTEFKGELRPLWWGLAKSRNNFSAWIIRQSNYSAVADLMHKMGIRSFIDAVPSMCLGPSDITLYEMTGAYSTFVNGGVHVRPSFVTRIEDKQGNVLMTAPVVSNEAINEYSASTIISILQKVVSNGTGVRLRWLYNIKGELGGKTGTTNDGSDGWFIGVTPKLVAGAWVGGENPSIHPEKSAEGSRLALPIFGLFMQKVHADESLGILPTDKFNTPIGFVAPDCPELLEEEEEETTNTNSRKKNFFM